MAKSSDPIEMLREKCLARGAKGIKGLGRTFRIYDDDGSKSLNRDEFKKGIHDYGIVLDDSKIEEMFQAFDEDGTGSISFDEFLVALRPKMNERRENLVKQAFKKLDTTGDNAITCADLKKVYNVRDHPKYKNGQKTEEEIMVDFLKTFQPDENTRDETVTEEEFLDYYGGLSASIDNDAYFDLMIRQAYKI